MPLRARSGLWRSELWTACAWQLVIVAAGAGAFANSFEGVFVFDDTSSILDNRTLRKLWPLGVPLTPPNDAGYTVSGRPLLNLSFALNYAISRHETWSYHALNLVIHLGCAVLLFWLARQTLRLEALPESLRAHANVIAGVASLLWVVHPLHTSAVTYVALRAESLVSFLMLLTLWAFVRGP